MGSFYSPVPPARAPLVVVFLLYVSCAVPFSSMQSIGLLFLLVPGDHEPFCPPKSPQRTKAPPSSTYAARVSPDDTRDPERSLGVVRRFSCGAERLEVVLQAFQPLYCSRHSLPGFPPSHAFGIRPSGCPAKAVASSSRRGRTMAMLWQPIFFKVWAGESCRCLSLVGRYPITRKRLRWCVLHSS